MQKRNGIGQVILHIIFIVMCLTYILPFLLLIAISFTDEAAIREFGYSLIPSKLSLEGYKLVFANPQQILNSYKTTIIFSLSNTLLMVIVTTMTAYPLSRSNFKFKKQLTWYIFITMLFGGGLVPHYIVNTQMLHLDNTIWIYIIPGWVGAWNVIIVRTFFQGIPEALAESAKIDGASEFYTFLRIMIPLSTPVMATIGFLHLIGKWNDWNTSLLYIKDPELYSLQYLLQRILREAEFVTQMVEEGSMDANYEVPKESVRYATAILAAGPMLVIFPFFQKYFTKGMTIGAVKG